MKYSFLKLLMLICAFTLTKNSYSQQAGNNISSKDYYDFLNSLVNPDSIHHFNLESNPDFNHILHDTAMFFND